jgi:ankyrin repeat protein
MLIADRPMCFGDKPMKSVIRNSHFCIALTLVLCLSTQINTFVYAGEVPNGVFNKQIKQESIKQNPNAQLLIAAQNGKTAEVRSLISQATDVNVRDEYGWTPLLWAAMNGHTEIVRILLVSGANPNTRNKYGWTPLMWAAGQGYGEIVRSLIASGARLNAQDRNGWTAIMWAWDGKQEETVAILRSATRE